MHMVLINFLITFRTALSCTMGILELPCLVYGSLYGTCISREGGGDFRVAECSVHSINLLSMSCTVVLLYSDAICRRWVPCFEFFLLKTVKLWLHKWQSMRQKHGYSTFTIIKPWLIFN